MRRQTDSTTKFALALSEADGFEECFKLLKDTVQQLGFDGALYMSIPVGLLQHKEKTPLTIFQASNAYAPIFLQHYAHENFAEHDYTIKATAAGEKGVMDWWGVVHKGILNEKELNVFAVAREEYKMRNGLSIPILSTAYEISGGSVVSYENDDAYAKLIKDHSSTIETLMKLFHCRVHADIACNKVFIAPLLEDLSPKERMLLKFMISGRPLKVIDKHCELSPGYAKNLLATVCAKLGAKNVHELIYLLGVYRLIELL